jgi:hypothetical protein
MQQRETLRALLGVAAILVGSFLICVSVDCGMWLVRTVAPARASMIIDHRSDGVTKFVDVFAALPWCAPFLLLGVSLILLPIGRPRSKSAA